MTTVLYIKNGEKMVIELEPMMIGETMKKKMMYDSLLSIFSAAIPLVVLNLWILPNVARNIGEDSYGQLIAVIAFMGLTAATLGNVLNNSRLIHHEQYLSNGLKGDYSLFLGFLIIANIILMSIGMVFFGTSLDFSIIIVLIVASVLMLIRTYANVFFRIKLKYNNILFDSVFLLTGYSMGFLLFKAIGNWAMIYFFGFTFSVIYLAIKTNVFREPLRKTRLFNPTLKETLILLGSGILFSANMYLDKLLLLPILGGSTVSIYFAATFLGKIVGMGVAPITGVFLSYLAQMKKFSDNNFKLLLILASIVVFFGYFFVIVVSRVALEFLYPQFLDRAMELIYITTLSIMVAIVSSVMNSVFLKFYTAKLQVIINSSYLFIYIVLSILLLSFFGLVGFCIGILIANIARMIMMIYIYYSPNNIKEKFLLIHK